MKKNLIKDVKDFYNENKKAVFRSLKDPKPTEYVTFTNRKKTVVFSELSTNLIMRSHATAIKC